MIAELKIRWYSSKTPYSLVTQ